MSNDADRLIFHHNPRITVPTIATEVVMQLSHYKNRRAHAVAKENVRAAPQIA